MKKRLVPVMILIVLFILTACSSGDANSSPAVSDTKYVDKDDKTEKNDKADKGDKADNETNDSDKLNEGSSLKEDPENGQNVEEEQEEEMLPRTYHKLAEAVSYQGADERILYGTYKFEKKLKSRWDEIQTNFHFHTVNAGKINRYREIYSKPDAVENVSIEPFAVSFGHKGSSNEDKEKYLNISPSHITEQKLKEKEEYYIKKYDGEAAVEYLQNLHKLYDYNYMEISYVKQGEYRSGFMSEPSLFKIICIYEVEGDTILYTPLEMNEDTLEVTLPPKSEWSKMKFGFCGTSLVLGIDRYEVELFSNVFWFWGEPQLHAYSDTPDGYNGIVDISLSSFSSSEENGYILFKDGSMSKTFIEFEGDNLMKVSWKERIDRKGNKILTGKMNQEAGEFSCYFLNADDYGFTLIIDNEIYYFMSSYALFYEKMMKDSLDEGADIQAISGNEDKLVAIMETQQELVSSLDKNFGIAEVAVKLDSKTGKVTMDNNILFAYNSAELSDEGRSYLDKFLKAYSEVVTEKTFEGKISTVKIEGHADISGSYDYNLELSEKRAESVAEYCRLKYPELAAIIKTEGKSYSEPIYNEDGTVNMEASRRVEFKAILNY